MLGVLLTDTDHSEGIKLHMKTMWSPLNTCGQECRLKKKNNSAVAIEAFEEPVRSLGGPVPYGLSILKSYETRVCL